MKEKYDDNLKKHILRSWELKLKFLDFRVFVKKTMLVCIDCMSFNYMSRRPARSFNLKKRFPHTCKTVARQIYIEC